MNIGPHIRQARVKAQLSQEELAASASINRTYLSQLENGHSSPTLEVLNRIAHALGMDPASLIPETTAAREPDPYYEVTADSVMYPGLQAMLDDERTRLLMKPTPEEIELLKSIRFLDRFKPSKQFFVEALFEYRRNSGENRGEEKANSGDEGEFS
ncbi:hypothetical protein CEE37_05045 [candidate division LCP-89 bacterium B3_LCP]|uniref:HTH cro/C1-type domain-containing protein n=1 Tax=candidate division LCP-89 bacterium B3_LCP TaxID=2012998 RepID=A0A532V1E0_UNCL8|nr:MAG: hypothetical protein CEE37_05045 [candidate division LCP-89 bacterium B3_LCP]